MAGLVPETWVDWTVDAAESFGLMGLFLVSATESAVQPVPPDLVSWPMALGAGSIPELLTIVIVATVGSVLGSLVGYWMGSVAGDYVLSRFASESSIARLEQIMHRHGSFGVFFAALGPVPYKALAWTAGAGSMPLIPFMISGGIGRLMRFSIPAVAIWYYGDAALEWFTPARFLLISMLGLILMVPVFRWMQNQGHPKEEGMRTR
ncbi:MAG: VTT domain-containing protein [Candidatus Thalassarchaeaceae archaeon]|nr:VTT domain-containing protein [Candidatus Thalassarchaeaceae archaeon]|tara:strand:- start:11974 stop:12591 length:618 start_codon:yes stop_codon:yes gene_type:complete